MYAGSVVVTTVVFVMASFFMMPSYSTPIGYHVSAANAFVRCQIDSLLCGFTASPVFALAGRLTFFLLGPKIK